jgi:hypothetical protein
MVSITPENIAEKYQNQMEKVCLIQETIQDVHPFLGFPFPIALVENDQFFIFDVEPPNEHYHLVMQAPTPMPIPAGVRAAFPLDFYAGKPACVVTGDVFDTLAGYATIFHEFMHCHQWGTCEPELKQLLGITQRARQTEDYLWEMNYSFPYGDPGFIKAYQAFLAVLESGEEGVRVSTCRSMLKRNLAEGDFEYLAWQEWKEGFARFIENLVRVELGLDENHSGQHIPFDRVTFYEGGARYIRFLCEGSPGLAWDIERLFHLMLSGA